MKNLLLFLAVIAITSAVAQNNDYVGRKEFQSETKKMSEGIQSSKKSFSDLKKDMITQKLMADSLQRKMDLLMMENAAISDSFAVTSTKIQKMEAAVTIHESRLTNGIYILGLVVLLFITAAFIYIRMVSVRTSRRYEELSELFSGFSMNLEKDLAVLKNDLKDTKEHIFFVSDELKEYKKNTDNSIEYERERSAMIDEKVKNFGVESEINHKVNREKIIALQQESEKNLYETEQKLKAVQSHMESELARLSKLIKSGKEKEEIA